MGSSRLWCLPGLLLACGDPSADACLLPGPVQLVRSDTAPFKIDHAGGHTYVSMQSSWVRGLDGVLNVGESCGADAREIAAGVAMIPVHLHPGDPDADDPGLVCDRWDYEFFRIDLTGERPPELLLPRFTCNGLIATPHGPVVGERDSIGLWHLPDFPATTHAVEISPTANITTTTSLGDRILYASGGLHSRDLATGEDILLVPDALEFSHTDTHVLWRGRGTNTISPMYVHELATGADHYLGLYHIGEDNYQWDDPGPGWRFDADGAHILHLPNRAGSSASAFDLTGAEVPFAGTGVRLAYPQVGGVVVQDGATIRHAVPGSAAGITLQVPEGAILEDLQVIGDHLELRVEADLYAVPLSGGPSELLVRGVPAVRTRIDDRLLVGLLDGDLILIQHTSNARKILDHQVQQLTYDPDHGLYYSRLQAPGAARNGVWWLSNERLHGALAN